MITFTDLVRSTGAHFDRRGEAHIACPVCGHPSSPKNPHCSFSEAGWHCFVCGEGGSLARLAELLGKEYTPPVQPVVVRKKRTDEDVPVWKLRPESYVCSYESHPDRIERWMSHKPLHMKTIINYRLGIGVLPPVAPGYYPGRCNHERLIVPIFWGTQLVGLRGRRLDCNCPGKWLQAKGMLMESIPLYNETALGVGNVVWIVENTVDALLISQVGRAGVGVATYSTSYWTERWEQRIVDARPEMVIVAFDNDLPGNGGALRRDEFIAEWKTSHGHYVPDPRGVKLVNRLLERGVRAILYDWGLAPHKADIGSLLQREVSL
jgi:hypothetical protein